MKEMALWFRYAMSTLWVGTRGFIANLARRTRTRFTNDGVTSAAIFRLFSVLAWYGKEEE